MGATGWIGRITRVFPVLPLLPFLPIQPVFAQSPNTAALVVIVVDQTGAVIPGARVTIVNTGTGDRREASSGRDGATTIAALPVAGSYAVNVTMQGFTNENVKDVVLRAGETATVRVKLTATGGASEVTVFHDQSRRHGADQSADDRQRDALHANIRLRRRHQHVEAVAVRALRAGQSARASRPDHRPRPAMQPRRHEGTTKTKTFFLSSCLRAFVVAFETD
jgi:hypothetical protein